ncbi:hypothetical protein ACEPAG_4351 [Sanghuangporus baumii]
MKSCLKCHSDHPVPGPSIRQSTPRPKCTHRVSFKCEDEVHTADDWDRTPVDVAHKLSYEDILELKELQVAAAKACARASAASGVTPKYLSNVPLGLLPLLPDTSNVATATSPNSSTPPPTSPNFFSPPPQNSPNGVFGNGNSNGKSVDYSPAGLGLAEACLCRVFSADTGLPPEQEGGHQQSYGYGGQQSGSISGVSSPPPQQTRPDYSQPPQFRLINGVHQIPSPPDTPPRLAVTSIPPPPPTTKARRFAFLPLLDASSSSASSSPARTPITSPSASGLSSPTLSPGAVNGSPVPPVSLAASLSMISSSPLSSSSSSSASSSASTPSPGAYTTYDPYGGSAAVGGSATLGLERKLGYKFVESDESDSRSVSSEEGYGDEGEDKDWPHDWPGRHPHHPHHPHHSHSNSSSQSQSSHQHTQHHRHEPVMRSDPKPKDNRQLQVQQQQQQQRQSPSPSLSPSRTPKLPPSPPAEPRPLPLSPLTSNHTSSPPRSASSAASPKGSPRTSRMSSPSPPPSSPSRARKSKMGFPLVTLA